MDLNNLLADHPLFSTAKSEDNPLLLSEIESSPMVFSGMEMTYERGPDFQKLLRLQSPSNLTLVVRSPQKLSAMASFSWGRKWMAGSQKTVMYIGDFRSESSLALAKAWRVFYPALINLFQKSEQFNHCEFLYTAILEKNLDAINSLAKKKLGKKFYYHLFAQPQMINVLFKKPLASTFTKPNFKLVKGGKIGENALRSFLSQIHSQMLLGSCFEEVPNNDWEYRKNHWPGFHLDDFLIALNPSGVIVACTLPWSSESAKRMKLVKAPGIISNLLTLLNALKFRFPKVQQNISTLYLTHLTFSQSLSDFQRAQVIELFSDAILAEKKYRKYHMISFADFRNYHLQRPLNKFFKQKTGINLYAVSTQESPPDIHSDVEVEFEMGLV